MHAGARLAARADGTSDERARHPGGRPGYLGWPASGASGAWHSRRGCGDLQRLRFDAERAEHLLGGLLLGRLLRRASADAGLLAVDQRRADVAAVVRRPLDLQHDVLDLPTRPGEGLLQLGLVVDVARAGVLDAPSNAATIAGAAVSKPCSRYTAAIAASSKAASTLRLRAIRCSSGGGTSPACSASRSPEPKLARDARAAVPRDDVGPDLGQPPLRGVGEAIEENPRDRQLEDRVPEELEALVRGGRSGAHDVCVKTCASRGGGSESISRASAARPTAAVRYWCSVT